MIPALKIDSASVATGQAPLDFVRMVDLQMIPMPNGVLGVAEATKQIGFPVRRVYFLKDVPEGASRGAHGHRQLRQCFLCLAGAVNLTISKGGYSVVVRLGETPQAAVVEAGCWRDLSDFTGDAVVVVLASEEYDEADYIRDAAEFVAWENGREPVTAVPYLDLARYGALIGPELDLATSRVIRSGALIGGPEVAAFEHDFAAYCEAPHMVGVGNGLDALTLTLRAWGIGPGDEVICPAHTFIATALAVEAVGATPVLVDVEPDTGLIDAAAIAAALTDRTRAVIPVHLYGHPADMDGIRDALAGHNVRILEDACQAHGARYRGRRAGSLGDAAAFSFYPTKNLGAAGDGGAVTADPATAAAVRRLANYGAAAKYEHQELGVNSRLDPMQAAILATKLPWLDAWNARRSALALRYFRALAGVDGLLLPAVRGWAEPVWHVFPIRVPGRRDALQARLAERGVGTNIHYPTPVHLQPCYAGRWRAGDFPAAEALAQSLLSLPLDPTHSEAEIDHVAAQVRAFFERAP
jgi:dTDP-4-amino-4,6-dideoxygalactose transaminase